MTKDTLPSRCGPYILAAMLAVLSVAFLLEWRSARAGALQLSERASVLGDLLREQRCLASALRDLVPALRSAEEAMLRRLEDRLRRLELPKPSGDPGARTGDAAPSLRAVGAAEDSDLDGLPPLPEELRVQLRTEDEILPDLVLKYRSNPEHRLNGLETAQALGILAEARAEVDVLRSRILVATLEGVERLRGRSEYDEFPRGQPYRQEPGVVSFGEDLGDRGMRIFYLRPEEFPEIYAMKDDQRRASETGLRRVLAMIQEEG